MNTANTYIEQHESTNTALRRTIKIGFADSGVGGMMIEVSVLKQIYPVLEFISKVKGVDFEFIHVGHNKYAPFGEKPKEEIALRTEELLKFCSNNLDCDFTILACNTASAVYKGDLEKIFQKDFPNNKIIPIIEPTAKYLVDKALENRANNEGLKNSDEPLRIAVLCTRYTNKSGAYQKEIKDYAKEKGIKDLELIIHSPKNWVSMIETAKNPQRIFTNITKETSRMVEKNSLEEKTIDALGLCCTHYPLLKRPIKQSLDFLNCNTKKPYSQGKLFSEILTDKLLEMVSLTRNDLNDNSINKKNRNSKNHDFLKLTSYYSGEKSPEEVLFKLKEAIHQQFYKDDEKIVSLGKVLTRKELENFIQKVEYHKVDIEQELANFKEKENGTGSVRIA